MSENKYTMDDLRTMWEWPLERKIQVTQTRILEWCIRWENQVYVSFSGGKDSTVLLDLARRVNPDISAVFIDTGLEYPEIRQFALSQPNVIRLTPAMDFRTVIKTYGYPLISKDVAAKIAEYRSKPDGYTADRFDPDGEHAKRYGQRWSLAKWRYLRDSDIPISAKCCKVMKKRPAKEFEKRTGLHPIIGTMAAESPTRKTEWLRKGCNAFDADRPVSKPMSFWRERDVLEYLVRTGIPYAPIYGDIVKDKDGVYRTTGTDRTGCVFCGFGAQSERCPNRFQRLKQTHPQLWDYCMRDWDKGGLGMKDVLEFVHVDIE